MLLRPPDPSPTLVVAWPAYTATTAAETIRTELVNSLNSSLPAIPVEQLVDDCISAWMRYVFPTSPICSEEMLRSNRHLIFESMPINDGANFAISTAERDVGHVPSLRCFTLVTACCAAAGILLPVDILPGGATSARHFFRASRAMLKLYEDADLDHPESTSITTRLLQSTVLHATGKTRASYHLLNQARLLAIDIYNRKPSSFRVLDSVESRLLRQNLANTLTGTRSAAVLADQPLLFNDELWIDLSDPLFVSSEQAALLDPNQEHNGHSFEQRLLMGVDICRRLWTSASNALSCIRGLGILPELVPIDESLRRISTIMEAYLYFSGILDDLPDWLQRPDAAVYEDQRISQYQSSCFWAQKTDLLMSYHCVRLIIVRTCIEQGATSALGIGTDVLSQFLKKIEMSQEFVSVLESVPFISLQANGEPCVSLLPICFIQHHLDFSWLVFAEQV